MCTFNIYFCLVIINNACVFCVNKHQSVIRSSIELQLYYLYFLTIHGDGAGNTIGKKSSVFSLIRML